MSRFPDNKDFAFSIFDDTDNCTVECIGPVYRLLRELGFRTTKSVWPLATAPGARFGGSTLQDRDYLEWILNLCNEGFEIGLHNVRSGSAPREMIERGFEEFRIRLGVYPRAHANHSDNRENIYWGASRLSGRFSRLAYNLASLRRGRENFTGHLADSEFFWGDICKERLRFVRNFVFDEINLERINPTLPYHDPRKPFVNFWFSSCEGADVAKFCEMISEPNQDRLAAELGTCIMYTHFASGFCREGKVHPVFERLMRRLSKLNGWFVPVSELLEFLLDRRSPHTIPVAELAGMENRWIRYKMRVGSDRRVSGTAHNVVRQDLEAPDSPEDRPARLRWFSKTSHSR